MSGGLVSTIILWTDVFEICCCTVTTYSMEEYLTNLSFSWDFQTQPLPKKRWILFINPSRLQECTHAATIWLLSTHKLMLRGRKQQKNRRMNNNREPPAPLSIGFKDQTIVVNGETGYGIDMMPFNNFLPITDANAGILTLAHLQQHWKTSIFLTGHLCLTMQSQGKLIR